MLRSIKTLGLSALFLLASSSAWALEAGRRENPLQLQINAAGGGGGLGYHFNESWFLGVSQSNPFSAFTEQSCTECDERRYYGQDGLDSTDLNWAQRQAVELRWSPWAFGFYFSLGYLKTEGDQLTLTYDKRLRIIGENAYDTGYTAEVQGRPYGGGALGWGINHVFEMGLSLGGGFLVGWAEPQKPEVSVYGFDQAVSQTDQDALAQDIQDNDPHTSQMMFHLSVGYNF